MIACVVSCRRTADVAKPDPTPPPKHVEDAARPLIEPSRALLHGNVVELSTGAVLYPHGEKKPPRAESAEIVLEEDETLRSIDLATGAVRWKTPAGCRSFALTATAIACAESAAIVFVDRANGGATRVAKPASSIDPLISSRDHFVSLQGVNVVVYDGRGKVRVSVVPSSAPTWGIGSRTLVASPEGYGFVSFDPPDDHVHCFDLDGKSVRDTKLSLSKPSDPPGTRMMPVALGLRHIVVGTFDFGAFPGVRRAAVVRIADGVVVTTVEDEVVAVAERSDGTLEGLAVVAPEIRLLSPSGAVRWKQAVPYAEPMAAAVVDGDTLYLARYNPIATGVQIGAFALADGKELWKGETKLPPIAHSKYRNEVTLELRPGALILRGDESSVRHVHLYDPKTGALRFHDAPPR